MCAGIGRTQDCRVDFSGYDWKKLFVLVSAKSSERGQPAAWIGCCVDWLMFMRGAAALAYLSLQHIKLRFDWMTDQMEKLTQVISLLTRIISVLDGLKTHCAFNGLRFGVYDKA